MRRLLTQICLLLSIGAILLIPKQAEATHAMGVDISYTHISGNTYKFTVTFYRDCAGVTAPAAVTLNLASGTCTNTTLTLTQVGPGVEVSPLCPSELPNSTCSGGSQTQPGVQKFTYEANYTFTQSCNDWEISWAHCCRNAAITNLNNPDTYSIYIEASLDNSGSLNNSSPTFTSLPVPYICVGQQFCYNHGAVDPDGDSLKYTLINAKSTTGLNIPYSGGGYSATTPILSNPAIVFDQVTGTMCVTPTQADVCVVTILVEEFRNGTKIAETMRDLQIVIQTCTNTQPQDSSSGITALTGGGAQIDSNSVEICPNDTVSFDVIFSDPNTSDSVFVTSNITTSIPGATFSTTGANPVTATFTWVPQPVDTGFHVFTITIQDNGCPILGSQVFAYDITVLKSTWAGPDTSFCPAMGAVGLTAVGGSSFTWSQISGTGSLSCTNCQTTNATPTSNASYEVVSNLSGTCKNTDTVDVTLSNNFTLDAGPNDSICRYGNSQLSATATPSGEGPFTYTWTPTSTLTSGSIFNPIANPLVTTTYYLSATSATGCVLDDSVSVVVTGVAPQVNAGNDTTVCPGTSFNMSGSTVVNCDTAIVNCTGSGSLSSAIGSNDGNSNLISPHNMTTTCGGMSIKRQFIVLAAELTAAGVAAGSYLQGLAFNYTGSVGTATVQDLEISLKCISDPAFSSGAFQTGLTVVRTGSPWTISGTGWQTCPFTTEYVWDGTSNLLVQVCTDAQNSGTATNVQYGTAPNMIIYANASCFTGACSGSSGGLNNERPRVRFQACSNTASSFTYQWTPSMALSDDTIAAPSNSGLAATTTYQLDIDDGGCVGSDLITVTIDSSVYVDAQIDTTGLCPQPGNIALDAVMTGTAVPPALTCGGSTSCTTSNHIEQVGTGGGSHVDYGPWYATTGSGKYSNRIQYIYTANEMIAAGMNFTGTISQVSINVTTFLGEKWEDIEIKMGCTSLNSFPNTTFQTGLTSVYSSGAQYTTTNGWNTFNITPYDWDGTSNLIVEFCARTFSNNTDPEDVEYTTQNAFRCLYLQNNCSNCNICNSNPNTGTQHLNRANMLFTICDGPAGTFSYTWSPGTGLSATNVKSPTGTGADSLDVYTVTVTGGACSVTDSVGVPGCQPLAIDEIVFTGEREANKVRLDWETLNEFNTSSFEIYHSNNGVDYSRIHTRVAAGHSQGWRSYSHLHGEPVPGMNYYVLKSKDYDGITTETDPVAVFFQDDSQLLNLYPNPAARSEEVFIEFHGSDNGTLSLEIMDMTGKKISERSFAISKGSNTLSLEIADLTAGSYFLRLKTSTSVEVARLMVEN